jgi:prophage regulatory protein
MNAEMLRLMRLPDVLATVGLGKSAWYALVAAGQAPKPVHIGRSAAWVDHEIAAFVRERIAERRQS